MLTAETCGRGIKILHELRKCVCALRRRRRFGDSHAGMPCYSWRMRIREATEQAESMWPRHVLQVVPSAVNKGLQGGHATETTTEPDNSDASFHSWPC